MIRSILTFLLLSLGIVHAATAEKHALIIAIGDYPQEGFWQDISSQNDIIHVKAALLKLGWTEENIASLYDSQATQKGIISQLEALAERVTEGDIVFIHYSGHGQQVLDDNGDELDQLDEALVPYDSPMIFEEGVYEGERLVRDDDIGRLTTAIRKKCGPKGQLILILDSCHSGTGTRGMGKARGTDRLMAPDDFVMTLQSGEKTTGISNAEDADLAPMASYFGASPRELNYETLDDQSRPVGSLSYAFYSVLANMDREYTFQEIYDRVKLKMKTLAPRQNPQCEGPSDVLILGGTIPETEEYYSVTAVNTPQTLTAEIGTLSDIFSGSTIEVYSRDRDEVLCRGEVTNAQLTSSQIQLEEEITLQEDELIVVRVVEKAYEGLTAAVSFQADADSPWTRIIDHLKTLPIVNEVHENADLFMIAKGDRLEISTRDGSTLHTAQYKSSLEPKLQSQTTNVIRSFIQGNFLKSYENQMPDHEFTVEIIIVDCRTNQPIKAIGEQDSDLPVGSCVQFKVTNIGLTGAYFSLIDIQPDNVINLIAPAVDLGYTADEYYLKPDASYTTNYTIEIAQPAGQETLKLISSKAPLDLSGIISTQGKSTRGLSDRSPFEQVFAETYNVNTRGAKVKRKNDEVGTQTLYFHIVEQ